MQPEVPCTNICTLYINTYAEKESFYGNSYWAILH